MGPVIPFIGAVLGFGAAAGASSAYIIGVAIARIGLLALAAKLTAPKPRLEQAAQAKLLTVRDTVAPQKFMYGQDMVSGPLVFANVGDTNNMNLIRMVALLGHEIDSFVAYRIDDTDIVIGGDIATATGLVSGGKYADVVNIDRRIGAASQTVFFAPNAVFPSLWTSAHTLNGWTVLMTEMIIVDDREDAFEEGIPQNLRALIKGKKIYDPRLDGSVPPGSGTHRLNDPVSWAWSENPALQLADFLRWDRIGLGEEDDRIDWTLVSTAADICDQTVVIPTASTQKRYTSNFTFMATDPRGRVKETLETAMLGRSIFSQGQWKMWAGAAITPDVTLTEANLRGSIQLKAGLGAKGNERYNRVRGKFIDPSRNYSASNYPEQRSSTYETEDGSVIYKVEDFAAANTTFEAQRNAIITLRKSRNQRVMVFEGNLSCFRIQPGTTITIDIDELGFSGEKFFVTEWSLSPQGGVDLTMVQEADSVWADPVEGDYSTRTVTGALVFGNTGVPAPTSLAAAQVLDGVNLTWTNPLIGSFDHIEIWGANDNTRANSSLIGTAAAETFFEPIFDNFRSRYYWIRAVNSVGQFSDWEPNLTTTTAFTLPLVGGNQYAVDPDFDLTTAATFPDEPFWDSIVFSSGIETTPGSATFNAGGGANSSNSITLVRADTDTTSSTDLRTVRRVRTNNARFEFRIRYRTNGATCPFFYIRASGFDVYEGGNAVVSQTKIADLPDTVNAWTDLVLQVNVPGTDAAQFWRFTAGLHDKAGDPGTVEIDSVFIYGVSDEFGVQQEGSSTANVPGLVPRSTSSNTGKFLKADATWGLAKPGQKQTLYTFSTTTTASDPGSGVVRLDNSGLPSVTNIYIDDEDSETTNNDIIFGYLQAGNRIWIQSLDDPTKSAIYEVTAIPTDNTGWWTIPVEAIDSNARPDNLDDVVISLELTGTFKRTTEEKSASVIPTDHFFKPGHARRYGAVIDGVTDDSAAITDWVNVGQQGVELIHPGGTTLCSTWTQMAITSDLTIRSDSNGIIKGTSSLNFIQPAGGDIDISGIHFDTWKQAVENAIGDSGTTDEMRIDRCKFTNFSGIPINHERPLNRAKINKNYFNNISPSINSAAYCIRIGTNTFSAQDGWQNFTISDNVADGIHATGSGDATFCLVYGHRVNIFGNMINDVDTGTGECWGIYTKTRYSTVINNKITDLVTSGSSLHAINIKGTDRGVSSSPNGFANIISDNVILLDNDGNGIRLQCEELLCTNNFIENADKAIVIDQPSTNTPENVSIIGNHVLISTSGSLKYGVALEGAVSGVKINDNLFDGQGGTGHCVRIACNEDCSDISINNNLMKDASRGVSDNTSATKIKTGLQINDNQFSTLSGDAIAVKGADNVQIHNNHFNAISGDYWDFDATYAPTKLSIKGNAGLTVQTTNGSATNIRINLDIPDETSIWAEITAVASEASTADCAIYGTRGLWYRTGAGALTQQGSDEATLTTIESDATWGGVTLVESTNALIPRVTGVASQTINWSVDFTCKSI